MKILPGFRGALAACFFYLCLFSSATFCYAKDRTVEVVGVGECADCVQKLVKTGHAFSGLRVTIDCKTENGKFKTRGSGELDKEGKFRVSLPGDIVQEDGKLKEECYAQLHSASSTPCSSHGGLESSKIISKSQTNDLHTFGLPGNLKFSRETCTSAHFWPYFKHPPHPLLPKFPPVPTWKLPPLKGYGHKYYFPPLPPKVYPPFPPKVFPPLPPKVYPPLPPKVFPPLPPKVYPPLPPKVFPPLPPKISPPVPVIKPLPPPVPKAPKKPCPPKVKPLPPPVPVPAPKKPCPPIIEKPHPPPVPVYTKPLPPLPKIPPIYKPKPPIYYKPLPPLPKIPPKPPKPPIYYKPLPPLPKIPPLYKPKPPIYYKPLPPLPKIPPLYKPKPPIYYKPLPPLPKIPPIYKKKPYPPLPKLPPLPKVPHKYFHHPKFGKSPPLPPYAPIHH